MLTRLTALFVLLISFFPAFADTFTVTSNADSGPGTLREAITLANSNGTSVTDNIVFNIPAGDVAGRTIAIGSDLPLITSNMIIDGTTQPGSKIGVSDARITITNASNKTTTHIFGILEVSNVSIYGIYIHDLNNAYPYTYSTAIRLHNAKNIIIGAPGKGNLFLKMFRAITDESLEMNGRGLSENISIQSNIFNLTEDGTSVGSIMYSIILGNVRNLSIGGAHSNEGNFICGPDGSIRVETDSFGHLNLGYLRLINNKLGCNYAQTAGLYLGTTYIRNLTHYGATDTTRIEIKYNTYDHSLVSGSFNLNTFMIIQDRQGYIDIKGNRINQMTGADVLTVSAVSTAFDIGRCENGIVGGDDPGDANLIAGCYGNGIALYNNKNITISKNSLWCNSEGIYAKSDLVTIPNTTISLLDDYLVQGKTLPNSKVEVFLNKSACMDCHNGKQYLGSTVADGQGNWSYTSSVLLDGPVTATGTSPEGATGTFAHPEYGFKSIFDTKFPSCNQKNGYIHGIRFISGTRYYWLYNTSGRRDTLFTEDIDNAAPGFYVFVVEQGKYCSATYQVSLSDNSPRINQAAKILVHPSCGADNGSIRNIYLSGSYDKIMWKDDAGNIISNNQELLNAKPGTYKLIILDTRNGCGDSTEYYTLVNQSGPSLNTGSVKINPSICGNNSGSITGITASNITGTAIVRWVDSLNRIVGTSFDLLNATPGKYQLKFKDGGSCDTIRTSFYQISDQGAIKIDTTGKLITASKCSGNTGKIQQLKVSGADSYQWINTVSNVVAGTGLDVYSLAPGDYVLNVSNTAGCTKSSPVITVPTTRFIPVGITQALLRVSFCGTNNGFIKINSFTRDSSLYSFRWTDSTSGQTIGAGTQLANLWGGSYLLYATDTNGCEGLVTNFRLEQYPAPVFDYTSMVIKPDHCSNGEGSISSLNVKGLLSPTLYKWYDQNNKVIGSSPAISNLKAGTYYYEITDFGTCKVRSNPLIVSDSLSILTSPLYDNMTVPKNTPFTLTIKNPAPGTYDLFTDKVGTQHLQQNLTGSFTLPGFAKDTILYVRKSSGPCSSNLTPVHITIADRSYFAVAGAFTPNNDGKNDFLHVRILGAIELNYFRIYNRWGELIYETRNMNNGWDGKLNNKLLDAGVFVWIAEGKDFKSNIIKQTGTVVLIR